ncbi:MAG: hypothetical protein AABW50_01520 [Nanoarchaeota archaeon]
MTTKNYRIHYRIPQESGDIEVRMLDQSLTQAPSVYFVEWNTGDRAEEIARISGSKFSGIKYNLVGSFIDRTFDKPTFLDSAFTLKGANKKAHKLALEFANQISEDNKPRVRDLSLEDKASQSKRYL